MYGGEEEMEGVKSRIVQELEEIIAAVSLSIREEDEETEESRLVQQLQGIRMQAEDLDVEQLDQLLSDLSLK